MRNLYAKLIIAVLILSSSFYVGEVQAQCTITITSFPFTESFENNTFSPHWTGDIPAIFGPSNPGWQTDNNGTPSGSTGPSTAQDGTFYAYTEVSSPATNGQVFNLNSPCFAFPANSAPYISFYNHMLTSNGVVGMGYLFLDVNTNPAGVANWITLFSDSGNNGDVWVQHLIDLSAYSGQTVQLRFRAVRGNNWQGDRAIDDIVVSTGVEATNGYCSTGIHATATASAIFGTGPYTYAWSTGETTPSISNLATGSYTMTMTDALATSQAIDFTVVPGTIPVISSSSYTEGWESGLGDWFNDTINDDFDWSVNSGGTGTGTTGPSSANEGTNYVYTEASFLNDFDEAILNSPCFDVDGSELPYLVFDYHMRVQGGGGSPVDMGILWLIADVTPETIGDSDTIWTQVGASGNNWLTDSVDLSAYDGQHVTLRFIGQLSNGITQYGDRAVDNLRVKSGVQITDACAGTNTGSITLDPQFGNGPYTYAWNTGSSSNPYGSLNAGSYAVTITNGSGATQSYSYTVGTQVIPNPTGISATLGSYCENDIQSTTLSINYVAGDAIFTGTSPVSNDLGPNGTVGTTVNYSINSNPPFATGPGNIIFNYRGDIEAPGEFVNVLSETGTQIGVANVPATQCNANFVQETFAVTVDSINAWASNGSIDFTGSPFGMTRYCGSGPNRFSQEGQVTITYPYSTNKPYWFANSCDNVIANAVDSGFVVTLSPATTTTYFVRYYNSFCQTWGACQSITITVNPKPTISVSPPNPSYCSTPTALTASGTSTYTWSPGTGLNTTSGATVLASPSVTTNYQVIGTDANTCSDTTNVTVTVTAGPSVSINSTNPTCNGGATGTATAIASGGTGAYTYLWSNGATAASISGLSAGTYTVTVDDGTTCTAVQSTIITDPAPLSITIAGNNIGCSGFNSGSAFAFVTGGTPAYTYAWSNGATTNVAFALAAGTYTVTVTDANGCTNTESVTITQPAAPLTSSITNSTNVSCLGGNDGSATAAGAGGTPAYSYAWSSGANTATASNLAAGTYICTVSDINGCVSVAIATITQPATAVTAAVTGSTNVTCNGGNDGSATAFGSGGTGAITYTWSNGATTATATGLTVGTYTVTATDANGCTDTDNVTITEPAVITATFISTNVSCNGGNDGTIAASGSGGNGGPYTYLWSTGSTSASINGLTAGTYSVTITDNLGCTGIETQAITEPALLVASITLGNNVSCNGANDGSATASATGGTTAYSFAWSNGATTAAVTSLAAGTYTVTVTDANLCTDTETITITEPTPVIAATALNNNVSCFGGNDGSATASASGGSAPYTFAWSNGGNTATVSNLIAGTFTVTATDANGCDDTETITITEPATAVTAAIALGNNVSCAGGTDGAATASASGGTAPYTFAWSNGATTANATGLAAGTYTVTATDANGCDDTETITITEPAPLVASITLGSNVSCNGGNDGSATASASGGTTAYSFAWSNGATTATVTSLAAGTYTVTVTDANLCDDTETITITEPAVLAAAIALGSNVSCNGGNDGSATASAAGGTTAYSFAWSNGATTAAVTGLAAGTYTVTVTDANLCTDTESITITEPTPLVASILSSSNISCFGLFDGSTTASASGGTAPYTYSWSSGASTATASGLGAGVHTVTITDANGCTDSESVTITQPPLLVASTVLVNNVSCNGGSDGSATVSGVGGTLPYTYSWPLGDTSSTVSNLSAGTQIATVTDANGCSDTSSITISEPAVLVASAAMTLQVSCNGGNDGSATASATGGTMAYSFAWSNGDLTAIATNLSAGNYTVTITDANGCSDTASVTITEPLPITLVTTTSNVLCFGAANGTVSVVASGGTAPYTYLWSTGNTLSTATNLSPGTYGITVTDANGCTENSTATITQPTQLIATAVVDSNVSCNSGTNGQASASGAGGTAPYTFSWSNGDLDSLAENLSAGTFTVTITDFNGCIDTSSIIITEPTMLVLSSTVANNVSCFGGIDGSASVNATGGTSPYTYLWSNGSTNTNLTNLAAGTIAVTVTDANGCIDTTSILISEPALLIASTAVTTNVSCNGGNDGAASALGVGGTMPYTYAWSNGATTASITGLSAGTYTVTITDANGCTDDEPVTITEPTILVGSAALINNVSCNGGNDGSVFAIGSGGTAPYTYSWSNGATGDTISSLSIGSYIVTITDFNNCEDTASITITEPAALVASASALNNALCSGSASGIALATETGGTAPYTYAWSNTTTMDTAINLAAGTYTVTITDANGCFDSASVTIVEPSNVVANGILISDAACNGSSTGSAEGDPTGGTAPYTYLWNNGAGTDTINNLSAGSYFLTVTDANGCTGFDTVNISEPALLVIAVDSINDVSCNAGNDGFITTSTSGGTAPYSYLWNNTATTDSISGLGAGSYTVTVTDANGCTASINPIVQEPSVLNSSILISDVNCNGGNDGYAIASGNGGTAPYLYSWSTGSAIDSTGTLSIGSCIVTITDDNGCTVIDTAVINEPAILVSSIVSTDSVNCAGDSTGSAIAGAVGGTSPYTYFWTSPIGTANDSLLSSIPTGLYSVIITDANGCTDTADAQVDEYPAIALTIDSTLDVTCAGGNDGYASVVATGGAGGYTYLWTNGATGMSTDTLMAGSQCVTVTDANGCSETICATLNETFSLPVVDLGNDTLLCDTIFTITSSNAVSYAWNTLENTQSINVQTAGTYTVTVTDSNGCENSDNIVVNFNPYLNFDITTDSTLCASATGSASIVNLTGGGGYIVNWSNGQNGGITASGLSYGPYSVSVTDANGCQATESFFIYNNTDLEFALSANDVSCFGANDGQATVTILDGTAPFTYNWSNGTTNDTASNLMGGTYSVTVSDSNGCEVIDSVAISEPDQVTYNIVSSDANCGANDGFAAVTNVSPAGIYSYAWNDPSSQTTDTASALGAGVYQVTITAVNGCADSSTAIVSNINAPTLAMSAIDETCEGSGNGSAIVDATSTSPLTYMWSDALMQTTDTASALGAGLYFVTVTDAFGCIGIDTVTVNTLSPLPMPNLVSDSLVCESSFDLTPGAGFTSYLWSDGSNGDTLNITASGIYSVTVTNAGGCENVDSVDITLSSPIAFTSTINNSSCSQNTGSITLVTSGGTGSIEYNWSTGDTLTFIDSVGAGNYLVTISDSVGCSVEADFDVDNINAPVVTISTTDLSCFEDNSGTASSAIAGGTAPFAYAWSNGSIGSSVNGLAAGNYDLTVVDDSGCVVVETFTIAEPNEINITISFVQPTCGDTNGSAIATVTNSQGPIASYLWDDPSNTAIADLDPIPAGFYTVTVVDSAGCQAEENVAINNLGAAILAASATDNNCSNENTAFATVTAIGGAPFTYEWSDALSQSSDTAFNLFNGTYAVSVTGTAGCIAVDVVTIGSSFDAPVVELGNNLNACIGSEVILTAGGGYTSYLWTTGATTPSIVATLSQTYALTVGNAAGCFNSDTISVQFVTQPIVDLGPDTIVCIDDFSPTVTLDAGEGFNFYEWSTNDTTQTIDVSTGGLYAVSASEFTGCAGSDQIIVVFDTCVNVNVDDLMNTAPSIAVYPNPNRGLFTIESTGLPLGDYQIRIMNASGQSVLNKQMRITGTAANLTEMDLQTSARGLYMMILEGESVRIDQRVIIQ